MAENDYMKMQMLRSRADWDKEKGEQQGLPSGRALESPPTNIIASQCEVCGRPFGSRVYYDNAAAKDTGFCSPEHVQLYREQRKARLAVPPPPPPKPAGRAKKPAVSGA